MIHSQRCHSFAIHTFTCLSMIHSSFCNNRYLIFQMVKREIHSRYRGSFLGLIWSFINPMLMLTIYTFVFSFVFKIRLEHQVNEDKFAFALSLFSGLIIFNLFSECVSRAPTLIQSNVNYVKKIIFPLEILPWVTLGSALFHAGISLLILVVFLLMTGHSLHWSIVYLPLILLPLILLIIGLSWLLASIGVFIRDIGQFIGLLLTATMFLSPIFYPVSALPESIRDYLFLNPLTFIIDQTRNVVLYSTPPDWLGLCIYYVIAFLIAQAGLFWFEKTRKGFADVL